MRTEVPYEPTTYFKRKTTYNNHNQISIVGSTVGREGFQINPEGQAAQGGNQPPLSPNTGYNKNATTKDFSRPGATII
jgi:hypothetical protein